MDYLEFLETKKRKKIESGFTDIVLNDQLFDFQKYCVENALRKGKFAFFEDCGLGKSIQQLDWAKNVCNHTGQPVIIVAPLAVVGQTIQEGVKFGYVVNEIKDNTDFTSLENGIYITNYDNLDNVDCSVFSGVVLDESSILKNFQGATKQKIIDQFRYTPYKLACTATPSPNDVMEICNHAEFLDVMTRNEMLAMYFVHDGGNTSSWRLKGHAQGAFWDFVSTWAVMLSSPSDIGFDGSKYILPKLNMIECFVTTPKQDNGKLFNDMSVNATGFHQELRNSMQVRMDKVVEIVNNSTENFIVWISHDDEGKYLRERISDAVEVKGSDVKSYKKEKLLGFANGDFRVLITKLKIAQFGLNYQNCHNQIFASLDFSFESTYQGIRRSYRFGQTDDVNVYLVITDTMQNVKSSFEEKQKQFLTMQKMMSEATQRNYKQEIKLINMTDVKEYKTDNCHIMLGDCVQLIKQVPDESIGFSIFSPPFAELYTYSDKLEDMGNSKDYKEFFTAFDFLVKEIYRVMWSGRNVAVHCMDLPIQKGKEGYIGLRDFSGMILKSFIDAGFIYHSRVTIWKNPVTEMQRTKALGLLHKQIGKDAAMCRVGIPDYLMVFRKDGDHEHPVHCKINVDTWQKYASPVWMDIDYSNTLNARAGREDEDEKHVCLSKGSLVLTKRGYIPIENVEIGDETLTHLGRWKKIIAVQKTGENEDVIKVYAQGVANLICTPTHKIYARDRKFFGRKKTLCSDINWYEAQSLEGKYVSLQLPPIEESELTKDECWIIGRYVADGHLDSRKHQFFISVGKEKYQHFINMAGKYIGAVNDKTKECNTYQIGLKNLSNICRDVMFKIGIGAMNKVIPSDIMSLNKELSKYFLDGYLSGDGCLINGKIYSTSVSRSLLLGIAIVAQRVYGKAASVYKGRDERYGIISGRTIHCNTEWNFCLSNKYCFSKIDEKGNAWKPVKRIEEYGKADVYNITVEDDHSYTAEGCVVKNCPLQLDTIQRAITLWSNEGDTVLTPFMGIGSEVYQSILQNRYGIGFELKDSYFTEAVKNIKRAEQQKNTKTLFD